MKLQSTWNPPKTCHSLIQETITWCNHRRRRQASLEARTSHALNLNAMRQQKTNETRRKQRRICTYICTVYVRKNLPSAVAPRRLSASTWVFPNARDPSWFASPGLRSPGRGTSSAPGEDSPHPSWEDLLPKPPPYVADGFLLGEIGSTWTFFTWF